MINRKMIKRYAVILTGLLFAMVFAVSAWAELVPGQPRLIQEDAYESGRLLVRFKPGISMAGESKALSVIDGEIIRNFRTPGLKLVELKGAASVSQSISALADMSTVLYAEPDYIVTTDATTPNDADFGLLWGMHQASDVDIDAPEAWDLSTGSASVIVGVIDTGVDYNHSDLVNNMWTNPGEIPGNGIDDDSNGWIDDVYGIDAVNDDGDPMDDHYHGTHCAGTIGAQGNNNTGVVGVNWNVSIMALKFLSAFGSGSTSDAITCIDYAADKGAHLTSNSWGGGGFSQGLKDSIENAGTIFVAAAGNNYGNNNDIYPHYPSSYDSPQIVSVLSTDASDSMSDFSNYGPSSVDVGAPGSDIWSTAPFNRYQYLSGTSMATPHVAGLAALLMAHEPALKSDPAALKSRILNTVDEVASLSGKCVTNGRINAFTALNEGGGGGDCDLDITLGYENGRIVIDLFVGTTAQRILNVRVSYMNKLVPLVQRRLRPVDPPRNIRLTLSPNFPSMGTIGILATLSSLQGEGITCSDWETINSGAADGAVIPENLSQFVESVD